MRLKEMNEHLLTAISDAESRGLSKTCAALRNLATAINKPGTIAQINERTYPKSDGETDAIQRA